jgi:membrane protein implicated in regulation of membrane protease activity
MKRNPFQREGDAFYLVMVIGIAALAVIAVSAINARAGAVVGLLLIVAALVVVWRWTRRAISTPDDDE